MSLKDNIQFYSFDGLPFCVIDNFFSKEEYEDILNECLFLSRNLDRKLLNPEDTGSAKNDDGSLKKKNKAIFLDIAYNNRNISDILNHNRKLFAWEELQNILIDQNTFWHYLPMSNSDSTLISYYEDSDYYASHRDAAIITAVSWFYKEPKLFDGGNLVIGEGTKEEVMIECKSNRLLLFPSVLEHKVTNISMKKDHKNISHGRFTMSQFVSISG